jgi:hypothetical protein
LLDANLAELVQLGFYSSKEKEEAVSNFKILFNMRIGGDELDEIEAMILDANLERARDKLLSTVQYLEYGLKNNNVEWGWQKSRLLERLARSVSYLWRCDRDFYNWHDPIYASVVRAHKKKLLDVISDWRKEGASAARKADTLELHAEIYEGISAYLMRNDLEVHRQVKPLVNDVKDPEVKLEGARVVLMSYAHLIRKGVSSNRHDYDEYRQFCHKLADQQAGKGIRATAVLLEGLALAKVVLGDFRDAGEILQRAEEEQANQPAPPNQVWAHNLKRTKMKLLIGSGSGDDLRAAAFIGQDLQRFAELHQIPRLVEECEEDMQRIKR